MTATKAKRLVVADPITPRVPPRRSPVSADGLPGHTADAGQVGWISSVVHDMQAGPVKVGIYRFTLEPGQSYHVADNAEPHRSSTQTGAKLYIVD